MIQLALKTFQKPLFAINQLDAPVKVGGIATIAVAVIAAIVVMADGKEPTTSTPISASTTSTVVVSRETPQITAPIAAAKKEPLALKPSTSLASAAFAVKSIVISDNEKALIKNFASDATSSGAAKIHLKGFSGADSKSYEERRDLAMGRAFAVKAQLVNDHKIEPSKIRVFFRAGDVSAAPSVQMSSFQTLEAAQKDAKEFFAFRFGKK